MKRSLLFMLSFCLAFLVISCQQKEIAIPIKNRQATAQDSIELSNISAMDEDNHSTIMSLILGEPKVNIKKIGILVYDGVNDLDLMAPRYILGQLMGTKTELIALKSGHFKTVMGIEIMPNTVIDSVDNLDILVIPGGAAGTILAAYDK